MGVSRGENGAMEGGINSDMISGLFVMATHSGKWILSVAKLNGISLQTVEQKLNFIKLNIIS